VAAKYLLIKNIAVIWQCNSNAKLRLSKFSLLGFVPFAVPTLPSPASTLGVSGPCLRTSLSLLQVTKVGTTAFLVPVNSSARFLALLKPHNMELSVLSLEGSAAGGTSGG
jgi:hypothetical protein